MQWCFAFPVRFRGGGGHQGGDHLLDVLLATAARRSNFPGKENYGTVNFRSLSLFVLSLFLFCIMNGEMTIDSRMPLSSWWCYRGRRGTTPSIWTGSSSRPLRSWTAGPVPACGRCRGWWQRWQWWSRWDGCEDIESASQNSEMGIRVKDMINRKVDE